MYLRGEITDGEKYMELVKRLMIASAPPKGAELIFPQCKSGVILEGDIDSGSSEKPTVIHYGRCQSTKQLWVFERGKGWYLPGPALTKEIPDDSKLPKFQPIQPITKPKGTSKFKKIY